MYTNNVLNVYISSMMNNVYRSIMFMETILYWLSVYKSNNNICTYTLGIIYCGVRHFQ